MFNIKKVFSLMAGCAVVLLGVTSAAYAADYKKTGQLFHKPLTLEENGMIERLYLAEKVDIARGGGFKNIQNFITQQNWTGVNVTNIDGNGNTVNADNDINGNTDQGNSVVDGPVDTVN